MDGPLSRRRRAVHSRARPSAGSSSTSTRCGIDDVANSGPDRVPPELVRRGGHQHDGHLGAVVTVGDRRHLEGEVQGNVVADADDRCGLGVDLLHDALGVERLAVAPRLEVQPLDRRRSTDRTRSTELVALGDEGDGHRCHRRLVDLAERDDPGAGLVGVGVLGRQPDVAELGGEDDLLDLRRGQGEGDEQLVGRAPARPSGALVAASSPVSALVRRRPGRTGPRSPGPCGT